MSYLVDTNVLSEGFRVRPHVGVRAWLESVDSRRLFISVLSLGEIQKGVEAMPSGRRKTAVENWLVQAAEGVWAAQLLAIDDRCAIEWGRMAAAAGRSLPAVDSLLAATAKVHGLTLLTRNVKDFSFEGLRVINPWKESPPSFA